MKWLLQFQLQRPARVKNFGLRLIGLSAGILLNPFTVLASGMSSFLRIRMRRSSNCWRKRIMRKQALIDEARAIALPWQDTFYQDLLSVIGDAQYVLLGEMSHGTH